MLLHVMARGNYDGMTLAAPRLRAHFSREAVLASDWYQERLCTQQRKDTALWSRHVAALEAFQASGMEVPSGLDLAARLAAARTERDRTAAPEYLARLVGTIGADPSIP